MKKIIFILIACSLFSCKPKRELQDETIRISISNKEIYVNDFEKKRGDLLQIYRQAKHYRISEIVETRDYYQYQADSNYIGLDTVIIYLSYPDTKIFYNPRADYPMKNAKYTVIFNIAK
jgi:hypothetical protein